MKAERIAFARLGVLHVDTPVRRPPYVERYLVLHETPSRSKYGHYAVELT
jgi:hypothetical protein